MKTPKTNTDYEEDPKFSKIINELRQVENESLSSSFEEELTKRIRSTKHKLPFKLWLLRNIDQIIKKLSSSLSYAGELLNSIVKINPRLSMAVAFVFVGFIGYQIILRTVINDQEKKITEQVAIQNDRDIDSLAGYWDDICKSLASQGGSSLMSSSSQGNAISNSKIIVSHKEEKLNVLTDSVVTMFDKSKFFMKMNRVK